MEFLKSWKTSIVGGIALLMGAISQMLPEYGDLIVQLQSFLIAVLAFFTRDADKPV